MKKSIFYILFSLFFVLFSANAQQIQWASKLIKFSTDLGGKQNGIKRILGKPDAFPQGGSSANAWMPKNSLDGREIIEVGFEKPQTVKQVAVYENLNSGWFGHEKEIGKHLLSNLRLLRIGRIILVEKEEKCRKYPVFSIQE